MWDGFPTPTFLTGKVSNLTLLKYFFTLHGTPPIFRRIN